MIMKSIKLIAIVALLCVSHIAGMARDIDISLTSGDISPLRTQRNLLFQVTWDNTLIYGAQNEKYIVNFLKAL